jgi:hypothetical protein
VLIDVPEISGGHVGGGLAVSAAHRRRTPRASLFISISRPRSRSGTQLSKSAPLSSHNRPGASRRRSGSVSPSRSRRTVPHWFRAQHLDQRPAAACVPSAGRCTSSLRVAPSSRARERVRAMCSGVCSGVMCDAPVHRPQVSWPSSRPRGHSSSPHVPCMPSCAVRRNGIRRREHAACGAIAAAFHRPMATSEPERLSRCRVTLGEEGAVSATPHAASPRRYFHVPIISGGHARALSLTTTPWRRTWASPSPYPIFFSRSHSHLC